jgi:hypothetical protein
VLKRATQDVSAVSVLYLVDLNLFVWLAFGQTEHTGDCLSNTEASEGGKVLITFSVCFWHIET